MDKLVCVFACVVIAFIVTPVESRCIVGITVPMCQGFYYNRTLMPNMLNHRTQDEASSSLQMFLSFVEANCSAHLKLFLCSTHIPVCIGPSTAPPCRSLCSRAYQDCAYLMRRREFAWPDALSCDKFPDKGLCIGGDDADTLDPRTYPPDVWTQGWTQDECSRP